MFARSSDSDGTPLPLFARIVGVPFALVFIVAGGVLAWKSGALVLRAFAADGTVAWNGVVGFAIGAFLAVSAALGPLRSSLRGVDPPRFRDVHPRADALLGGLLYTGVGVAVAVWAAANLGARRAEQRWPLARGVVVSREALPDRPGSERSTWRLRVVWRYEADGRAFKGDSDAARRPLKNGAGRAEAEAAAAALADGDGIDIRVDPGDPSRSVLAGPPPSPREWLAILFSVPFVLCGLCLLWRARFDPTPDDEWNRPLAVDPHSASAWLFLAAWTLGGLCLAGAVWGLGATADLAPPAFVLAFFAIGDAAVLLSMLRSRR